MASHQIPWVIVRIGRKCMEGRGGTTAKAVGVVSFFSMFDTHG